MAGFMDFFNMDFLNPTQGTANGVNPMQNPINLSQINIPTPGLNLGQNAVPQMRTPMGAPGAIGQMPNPMMAKAAAPMGMAPQAQPAGMPGAQAPTGAAGVPGAQNQQDSMRKMMLMQYLMGGEEEPIQGPNGALPSGSGMRGAGGAQTDPNAGLLNSMVAMQPRKRFLGQS